MSLLLTHRFSFINTRICFALCNNLRQKERKVEQNVDTPHCHFSSKTSDVFYCWLLFIHIYLMNGFIDFFFFFKLKHIKYMILILIRSSVVLMMT